MTIKHINFFHWKTVIALSIGIAANAGADGIRTAPQVKKHSEYTDQIIVQLKNEGASQRRQALSAGKTQALSLAAGAHLRAVRPTGASAQVVKLPQPLAVEDVQKIAAKLSQDPSVLYAEPDRRRYAQAVPTDPSYIDQWYLFESTGGINAEAAWDTTTGSASIVIAVIDTGVVLTNRDLTSRMLPGYDFINADTGGCSVAGCPYATANDGNGPDADPSDPGDGIPSNQLGLAPFYNCLFDPSDPSAHDSSWHGTHVTGIIGADSNNGVDIVGVDWMAKILPVRVLGKCGGYTSDIVDGMRWSAGLTVSGIPANTNPADILNLSLGGPGSCSTIEQNAITEILNTTAVKAIITSAGNDNQNASQNAPGNCNGVINVGATTRSGGRASYSDYGSFITISAPGGFISTDPSDTGSNAIISLYNNGTQGPTSDALAFFSGTSAATPQVSGVVSLMLAANPSLTRAQVRTILTATARPFPPGQGCSTTLCGAGIADAEAAVRAASDGDLANPSALPFGNTATGSNTSRTFTITNFGGSSITFGTITPSTSEFVKTSDQCSGNTVASGNTCSLQIQFRPGSVGGKTATLSIPSNSAGGSRTIALSGSGVTASSDGGSGGGGGCTMGNGTSDPSLVFLMVGAIFGIFRKAKKSLL